MNIRTTLACVLSGLLLAGCSEDPSTTPVPPDLPAPPSGRTTTAPEVDVIRLEEQGAAELGITTQRVSYSTERFSLSAPGTVFPAPDNIALVSAPISGRVERIYAHEGEAVVQGEKLLELESLEFAGLVSDYLVAKADETYNRQQEERLHVLVDKKISPRSALDRARADLQRAEAIVRASMARLNTLGVTDAQLDAWLEGADSRPVLVIRAPISGVISEHAIDLGQAVTVHEMMLSLIDLEQVMVRAYVSPEDAVLVRAGDPVHVRLKEFPDRSLRSQVSTINPALDEMSRSVGVNVITASEEGWLMPGQNVDVEIRVAPLQPVLSFPLSAVAFDGDETTVFVRTDVNTFERRTVDLGRVGDDFVTVTAGLVDGEEVAVSQVFSLKALGRYEQYAEE